MGVSVWVAPPPHKIRWVELVFLGKKHPQWGEIGDPFVIDLEDIFGILDDCQKIRSGILNCGQMFLRPDVSRVVVILSITALCRDFTINVGVELLILQPHWWGEAWNDISASEKFGVSNLEAAVALLVSSRSERAALAPSGGEGPPPLLMRLGRRYDHIVGRRLGGKTSSKSVDLRLASVGFFSRLSW